MFHHRIINHCNIYLFGLIFLGVCLPLSKFGMSVGILILAGNWILELDFKRKLAVLRERKSLIVFISLLLIHLIWLFNTSDFQYAFKDIRIKLPLLVLPLVIGTSKSVSDAQLKVIILSFIGGVFAGTVASMVEFL